MASAKPIDKRGSVAWYFIPYKLAISSKIERRGPPRNTWSAARTLQQPRRPASVAYPGPMAYSGASAATRARRVWARGRPANHATSRSTCRAAAIATLCPGVVAQPRLRARRIPKTRTPCASVPAIPARRASCRGPSARAYPPWAAWRASYCGRGWRLIVRACAALLAYIMLAAHPPRSPAC